MKAVFTLTSSESKRLLAKAVALLPEVQNAMQNGMIIIGGGTTNAFVLEELTGEKVDKVRYTAGVITRGRQCVTPEKERIAPVVLVKGEKSPMSWAEAVEKMEAGDVFIKGGNAIDNAGVVGVLLANPVGGTIGKALPIIVARGSHLIMPVGLEKMIPDVNLAANVSGIKTFDKAIGMRVGLMPVTYGLPLTEIEALEILADIDAYCISAGGVGGSEGSVVMVVEGEDQEVEKIMELVKGIKGEPPVGALKQKCSECGAQCSIMEK
ncbi:hypothetical protein [Desulfitibacter alkalitolerans]|uniref:hypothetical protein n=1 Tax=Desulfitibacter alkalitolerans TaxID=264641 RepID=UPI0004807CE0|nr:hypothetical protein [Desulfitibacter alkalitolerans]